MMHSLALPDIAAVHDEMVALRRHLHAHPELGFQEFATSDLVARRLEEWGYRVTRGVGQTGVVATLQRGPGKSLGIRADMDALPIAETTGLPHASTHAGVMHACGHDGHTAMLLAAARYLAQQPNFSGTLHLIFQPAEEGGGGAKVMIEDGLFERFPCDAVFAMHNVPGFPTGHLGFASGPFMCSADTVHITLHGHGAGRQLRRPRGDRLPARLPGAGEPPGRNRAGARRSPGVGRRESSYSYSAAVHRQRRFRLYVGEVPRELHLDRQRPRHAGQFFAQPRL